MSLGIFGQRLGRLDILWSSQRKYEGRSIFKVGFREIMCLLLNVSSEIIYKGSDSLLEYLQ